jgi:oligosaccharide repeat unit polymerase
MQTNVVKNLQTNKSNLKFIIGLQCCIIIFLIYFRLLYEPFESNAESLIYPFSCIFFGLTLWSFWSWNLLTKNLFNPYLLFVLSATLFNGGQIILEVFHLNENGILGNWEFASDLSLEDILNTVFLIILSMATFHLGALICLAKFKLNYPQKNVYENQFNSRSEKSYIIGTRLLYLSFLPALFVIRNTISIVLSSGYTSLYQQESATSFSAAPSILADFLVPGALFLLAGSKEKPKGRLVSATIIILYAITQFFVGERNQAVMPLIAFAWLWHQLISPIPKAFLFGTGSLIMFVVFPLIAATRSTALGSDRFSINFLLESFSSIDNPAFAAIAEMGGSILPVVYTLQLVPSVRNFQMGADYLYALFTIVPNVFGKLHPTVARGLAEKWLTAEVNPDFAFSNGSYGYTFIAEAYLNFGAIGAPIALGVIGFLFTKLTLWVITSNDPAKMAMLASFLSFFLFYARAESALIIRPLVWYSIIPYLGVNLISPSFPKRLKKRVIK